MSSRSLVRRRGLLRVSHLRYLFPFGGPGRLSQQVNSLHEAKMRSADSDDRRRRRFRALGPAPPHERFHNQLGAMVQTGDDGLIAGIGMSNITLDHLLR